MEYITILYSASYYILITRLYITIDKSLLRHYCIVDKYVWEIIYVSQHLQACIDRKRINKANGQLIIAFETSKNAFS